MEIEVVIHEELALVDTITFLKKMPDGSWTQTRIPHQFYVDGELYNPEEKKKAGTYTLGLSAKKGIFDTIDWQITSQGKILDYWLLWYGGSGPQAY